MPAVVIHKPGPYDRKRRRSVLPELARAAGLRVAVPTGVLALLCLLGLAYCLVVAGGAREAAAVKSATTFALCTSLLGALSLTGFTFYFHRSGLWLAVLALAAYVVIYGTPHIVSRAEGAAASAAAARAEDEVSRATLIKKFLGAYRLADMLSDEEQTEGQRALRSRLRRLERAAKQEQKARVRRASARLEIAVRSAPALLALGKYLLVLLFSAAAADLAALKVGIKRGFLAHGTGLRYCHELNHGCTEYLRARCEAGKAKRPKCWRWDGNVCPCQVEALRDGVPGWKPGGPKLCPNCPVYMDHQRDKFRLAAPLTFVAAVLLCLFPARAGVHGVASGVLSAGVAVFEAVAKRIPLLNMEATAKTLLSPTLHYATMAVFVVFLIFVLLRVVEFVIFRLKW